MRRTVWVIVLLKDIIHENSQQIDSGTTLYLKRKMSSEGILKGNTVRVAQHWRESKATWYILWSMSH